MIWEDIKVVNYGLLKVKLWTNSTRQCVSVCSKKQERVQQSRRVHRRHQKALAPKFGPLLLGSKLAQKWLLWSRRVHKHPYCGVLWENCRFLIWHQKALGPKFGPRGQSHPKNDCWGPAESIDTHIVGFFEKSADFWIWRQRHFDQNLHRGVRITPNHPISYQSESLSGVQVSP